MDYELSLAELLDLAKKESYKGDYIVGRVFRNYDGGLDMHIDDEDLRYTSYYRLTMPKTKPCPNKDEGPIKEEGTIKEGVAESGAGAYPQPIDWHHATAMTYRFKIDYYGEDEAEEMESISLDKFSFDEQRELALIAGAAL